ncbi:MAG: hypothetical protein WKG52_18060 [Variovorax sp.]
MRITVFLINIVVLFLAYRWGSLTGLLIACGFCVVLVAASFALSTSRKEARESRGMQSAMGRSSTFLARLGKH